MIFYSSMRYGAGAADGLYVRGTATTVKEYRQVIRDLIRAHGPSAVFTNDIPIGDRALKSKAKPFFSLREEFLDTLIRLEAAKVPDEYLWVQIYRLKQEYWLAGDPDDKVTGSRYFVRHLRAKVGDLLREHEGLVNPDDIDGSAQDRLGLILINSWIEKFDLGRRDDLKQRYIHGRDVKEKYVSASEKLNQMDSALEYPENVKAWKLASPEERLRLQKTMPWIVPALKGFGLEPEKTPKSQTDA